MLLFPLKSSPLSGDSPPAKQSIWRSAANAERAEFGLKIGLKEAGIGEALMQRVKL
jgi:hypothetical protein